MSEITRPPRWQIIAAFAAIYILWGSTYLGIRFALETLPPLVIAGVRFLLAGTALYVLARRQGAAAPTRTHWRTAVLIGGLMFLGGNGVIMLAQQRVPSGLTSLLLASVPMSITLQGWLIFGGQRPAGRVFAGLLIGLAGITLLIGPGELGGQVDPLGAALLLGSSLIWGFASLLSQRLPTPSSALLGAGMNLLAGGALLLLVGLLTGEWSQLNLAAVSSRSLLAVIYLIIFGSVLGFGSYMWLLSVVPANRVATYAYVNPVVAVFLGWALAGETITPYTLVAAAVIVTSVVLITSASGQPASAPKPARFYRVGARLKARAVRAFSQIL